MPHKKPVEENSESLSQLTFRGQRPNEQVILMLHQHPFVLFKTGLMVVILLVVVGLSFSIFAASAVVSFIILVSLPIIFLFSFSRWYSWSNTVFVLTDQRTIAVYQKKLMSRKVSETELENIVSIEHTIEGATRSLLNYGDVNIRSSGAAENEILLENIYDPYGVQQKILDQAKRRSD